MKSSTSSGKRTPSPPSGERVGVRGPANPKSKIRNPKSTAPAPGSAYFAPKRPPRVIHQTVEVVPLSDGSFRLIAHKPRAEVEEIGTKQAAAILGLGITATKALRDSALGSKTLRWRYTTENKKVLKWELPSVLAFKEQTRSIGT